MASIQALVPRASLRLHSKQLQYRLFNPGVRLASSTPPTPTKTGSAPKPRVLEKPERFNPPSHPSRLRYKPKYSVPLNQREREAQKTRRYPHMMPPEGSFMYWFLTNRYVHAFISMSILFGLIITIWIRDFVDNTPYQDILPPNSMFLAHPLAFFSRYWEVYQMHVEYTTAETLRRRREKTEDVRKRSEFRKAHGMDEEEGRFGGWTAKTDAQALGPALREGTAVPAPEKNMELVRATTESTEVHAKEDVFVDFEGKEQPVKKKWFGIW